MILPKFPHNCNQGALCYDYYMRIGIFTDIYRPAINGVTTSIDAFREELEKKGHTVFIFAPVVEGAPKEKNVYRLPSVFIEDITPENVPIGVPILPIINKTIKPLKLDIIHTQLPFLIGYLGHHAAQKLGIPEVTTYHSHLTEYAHYVPSSILQPLVKYGLKRLAKSFCNKSDVVIAPSTSIKELLLSYGVTSPIVVNPTGVDLKDFKRLNKEERNELFIRYHIPLDKDIILFGGRLAKEKNLYFLLNCYKKILGKRPKTYLVYAGGGVEEERLRSRIKKLKLENNVCVTGPLEKTEIAKFFGAAEVFAYPSVTETQGLVLCEAMAGGTPVVAIGIMGPKDIITSGVDGYLTKNNPVDFTQKVIKLLDDKKLREQFTKRALKDVQKFSIENCTDRLISIYKEAITNHNKNQKRSIWNKVLLSWR